jgi:hypothetical protein
MLIPITIHSHRATLPGVDDVARLSITVFYGVSKFSETMQVDVKKRMRE